MNPVSLMLNHQSNPFFHSGENTKSRMPLHRLERNIIKKIEISAIITTIRANIFEVIHTDWISYFAFRIDYRNAFSNFSKHNPKKETMSMTQSGRHCKPG